MPAPADFGIAPLRRALMADPIAFLQAEHARQLALLGHLERLARAPAARGARVMAGVLLRWMEEDLPMHVADEEASLHPRLRPHDAGGALALLAAEHRRDAALVAACLPGLRAIAAGRPAAAGFGPAGFVAGVAAFLRLHRQHLDAEDRTIMPLARAVIDGDGLRAMATEMAARRGLAGTDHA
jgi:hemerythrin-like domain-containing protein